MCQRGACGAQRVEVPDVGVNGARLRGARAAVVNQYGSSGVRGLLRFFHSQSSVPPRGRIVRDADVFRLLVCRRFTAALVAMHVKRGQHQDGSAEYARGPVNVVRRGEPAVMK